MNKELIKVAKDFVRANKKAKEQGIIGVYGRDELQIYDEDIFRDIAGSSEVKEAIRASIGIPYEYSVEVDGLTFFTISKWKLFFDNIKEASNED